jgi:hypothetical protein
MAGRPAPPSSESPPPRHGRGPSQGGARRCPPRPRRARLPCPELAVPCTTRTRAARAQRRRGPSPPRRNRGLTPPTEELDEGLVGAPPATALVHGGAWPAADPSPRRSMAGGGAWPAAVWVVRGERVRTQWGFLFFIFF